MLGLMGILTWYHQLFSRTDRTRQSIANNGPETEDAETQFALGLLHSLASGNEDRYQKAAYWYRKAAAQGHSLAQFNLGIMHTHGQGVPKDDGEAEHWTRMAAEGGDAGAQFSLGSRYHHRSAHHNSTDNREESRIEAYKWFHLAEAQDYPGSGAASECLTLGMSQNEVTEASNRATDFTDRKTHRILPKSTSGSSASGTS